MGRIKRIVDVDFWTDEKVVELFSPEDKYFFIYLLTNPHTTQLGIYHIAPKIMAFELGYSVDAVNVLLDRFENKYGLIKYKNGEIAIKNTLRHSIVKGGKPVEDLLKKEISQVKNKSFMKWVYESVKNSSDLNETVKKILPLLNENGNDNDNDVSYHDSYHDSSEKRQKGFVAPTVDEVKAYCDERHNNIIPSQFIDYYQAQGWVLKNGRKMVDWKAAVRNWESRRNDESPQKGKVNRLGNRD